MGIWIVSALVLLAAGALIAYPLLWRNLEPFLIAEAASTPFSERDSLLEAMSELELEYGGGKISEDDYRREQGRLQRQYLAAVEEG